MAQELLRGVGGDVDEGRFEVERLGVDAERVGQGRILRERLRQGAEQQRVRARVGVGHRQGVRAAAGCPGEV
ncbi:hypothetical protein, partial [Paraburkholderia ginsengiterrae]|uniref:hypothetical protein n=1 Tax=Paraburkholderia ginsengiterrae TaxID=1462993 RepID=UPI001ABF300F